MFKMRRLVIVAAAIALGGIGAITAAAASGAGALFSPQKSMSVVSNSGIQGYSDVDMDWNVSGTITSTGNYTGPHHDVDVDLDWDISGTITSTGTYTGPHHDVDGDLDWDISETITSTGTYTGPHHDEDGDLDWDMSETLTSTESFTGSNRDAVEISTQYSVPLTSVVDLHNAGWGYGEIVKLYQFAQLTGKTAADIQAMRNSGLGWGEIAQALGIKVGEGNDHGKDGEVISGSGWMSGTVLGDAEMKHERSGGDSKHTDQQDDSSKKQQKNREPEKSQHKDTSAAIANTNSVSLQQHSDDANHSLDVKLSNATRAVVKIDDAADRSSDDKGSKPDRSRSGDGGDD